MAFGNPISLQFGVGCLNFFIQAVATTVIVFIIITVILLILLVVLFVTLWIIFLDELDFRALRGFGRSGEGGAELARFRLFPVLMEVCVDFDAAFLVFG